MAVTRLVLLCGFVFLALKLTGQVDEWSWGFVLLPWSWFLGACAREVELEAATGQKFTTGI